MINCVIIDDEPLARTLLMEYLTGFPEINVVKECNDGFEGVKAITQHQPHFIFLDIQMPKINGFEMLELIEDPPAVIFTTAFDSFAMKAFEAHAIDYLLKPFSKERFNLAVQKLLVQLKNNEPQNKVDLVMEDYTAVVEKQNRIVVKHNHSVRIIPLDEVAYLEAYGDYIKVHTADGVFVKKQTMGFYETHLDPKQFIRVHRSFIVSSSRIQKIQSADFVLLKAGDKIPVSKSGYSRLKSVLGI
ncbi:MAG: response regulator [Bacteroidia bacterium]|nr:response regulator [Bacteroidia bacterium]